MIIKIAIIAGVFMVAFIIGAIFGGKLMLEIEKEMENKDIEYYSYDAVLVEAPNTDGEKITPIEKLEIHPNDKL